MEPFSPLLTASPRIRHMLRQEKNTFPQWEGCGLPKLKLMLYKYCLKKKKKKANYQGNRNKLKQCLLPDSLQFWTPVGVCAWGWGSGGVVHAVAVKQPFTQAE